MDKGRVQNQGTYDELKEDEKFKQIIKHITKTKNDNNDEEEEKEESSEEDDNKETKNYMSTEGLKITEREEDEDYTVNWKTYVSYASFCIPALVFLMISVAMMMVERYYDMYTEYIMMDWLRKFTETNEPNYEQIYSLIKISFGMMLFSFSSFFCNIGRHYVLDRKLFKSMMKRLINAPINLYFDKTTTGKILGRFEEDMSVVTRHLPGLFKWNIHELFKILMTVCIIAYYSPACLLIVPVLLFSTFMFMNDFISLKKKIELLYCTIGTPAHTHTNESIEGKTTIRTFNKSKMFEDRFCELKDRDYSIQILDKF